MKKIGLFYGTSTAKTSQIAEIVRNAFGKEEIDMVSVDDAWANSFKTYDSIIVGTSTWFDGELPSYWDELKPELESLSLNGKKIAIFGLGDQKRYPENFADGVGILAELFESVGAKIVGLTTTEGYSFEKSKALRDGKFLGLVIDIENQSDKTKQRVKDWVAQLKNEFD